jgi:hypothetical protein
MGALHPVPTMRGRAVTKQTSHHRWGGRAGLVCLECGLRRLQVVDSSARGWAWRYVGETRLLADGRVLRLRREAGECEGRSG